MRFSVVHGTVKAIAIAVGLFVSVVSWMSVVGIATSNGWIRLIVALVLALALPAFLIDRLLPKQGGVPAKGFATDVLALVTMAFALGFVGLGGKVTAGLLVREGDRLAAGGMPALAHVVYWLGGVKGIAPSGEPAKTDPPGPGGEGADGEGAR